MLTVVNVYVIIYIQGKPLVNLNNLKEVEMFKEISKLNENALRNVLMVS